MSDIRRSIRENRGLFAYSLILMLLGIAFGIYLGIKSYPPEPPCGIFALIFCGEYAPFSAIGKHFLRYLPYFAILFIGGAFLSPTLFGGIGILFFAKYWAQFITLVFRADVALFSLLSLLLVYLPLIAVGFFLLFLSVLFLSKVAPYGQASCRGSFFSFLRYALGTLAVYFLLLVLLYFVVCGIIYLFVVSI